MDAGNNHGAVLHGNAPANVTNKGYYTNPADGSVTVIDVFQAYLDDCSAWAAPGGYSAELTGRNVGDLLNAKNISWGWFSGGFAPTQPAVLNPDGSTKTPAVCGQTHTGHEFTIDDTTYVVPNPTINFLGDIHIPTNDQQASSAEPFQYYACTRNPHHLLPSSVAAIGTTDQANHQYDILDFVSALKAGNFPAVSFLKPPWYAVGHPGISDPLTEQAELVQLINQIMMTPEWESTAIVITWDDFGGWYDHVAPPCSIRRILRSTSIAATVNRHLAMVMRAAASVCECRSWPFRPGRNRTTSSHCDRAGFDPPFRRGQLGSRLHRWPNPSSSRYGVL